MQMPTIAAQAVVGLRDIPIATSTSVLFQQLGPVLFIAVSQSVILNQLLPQMQAINPDLTAIDIIRAGVYGIENIGDRDSTADCFSVICKQLGSGIQGNCWTVDDRVYHGIRR